MDNSYRVLERRTRTPYNEHESFQLHNHDYHEIFLFLEGDCTYQIEGKSYSLDPYDMMVIPRNEFHHVFHNHPAPYHRFIAYVKSDFFIEQSCPEYESLFLNCTGTAGNKIPANVVRSSGIYDSFVRYKNYSKNFTLPPESPMLQAVMIELLYLMNQTTLISGLDFSGKPVHSVITYLNEHFTESISLDLLQEKFFISKYHLCRSFRKLTGLSIHEYLRQKRLAKARELHAEGMSLNKAAIAAGFPDYTAYYRARKQDYDSAAGKD